MGVNELDLFCLGGASIDLVLRVPRIPAPDDKMLASLAGRFPGGLVANTACAAARLGLKTRWAGMLGSDEAGDLLLADFTRYGVDVGESIRVPQASSDLCVILLQPSGERSILVVNSLPGLIPLSDSLLSVVERSRVVYTLPYQVDWFLKLAGYAHSADRKVAVDIESAVPLQDEQLRSTLQVCDLVFCNTEGLRVASGKDDIEKGAKVLLEMGVEQVVVTQGAQGASAFSQQATCFRPAFLVQAIDSTGAGDCFHAAYLYGYLEGWSIPDCLRFANAAAALSVLEIGARGGIPNLNQVKCFLTDQDS